MVQVAHRKPLNTLGKCQSVIDQIEVIIAQGTEGEADADYWKKIAKIIKDNGAKVIQ